MLRLNSKYIFFGNPSLDGPSVETMKIFIVKFGLAHVSLQRNSLPANNAVYLLYL